MNLIERAKQPRVGDRFSKGTTSLTVRDVNSCAVFCEWNYPTHVHVGEIDISKWSGECERTIANGATFTPSEGTDDYMPAVDAATRDQLETIVDECKLALDMIDIDEIGAAKESIDLAISLAQKLSSRAALSGEAENTLNSTSASPAGN